MVWNMVSLLFFLLLLYLAVLYQSPAACALMLLVGGGIFYGIFRLFYDISHLQFQVPETLLDASQKGSARFMITAKNTGIFPVSRVSMKLCFLDGQHQVLSSSPLHFSVPGKQKTMIPVEFSSHLYGKFQIEARHLRVYSPFSLVCFPLPCSLKTEVLFYPKAVTLDVKVKETTRYFVAENEGFEEITVGNPVLPADQIRVFLPGDRVRQIHWKLSARAGELLVRDMGKPEGFPVLVFLQLLYIPGKKRAECFSRFLEFAVSLSFSLMEARCSHLVLWFDEKEQHLVRYPIRTEEELTSCIYALLHADFYGDSKDLYDLFAREFPGDTFCTRLLLSTCLTLALDTNPPEPCKEILTITV